MLKYLIGNGIAGGGYFRRNSVFLSGFHLDNNFPSFNCNKLRASFIPRDKRSEGFQHLEFSEIRLNFSLDSNRKFSYGCGELVEIINVSINVVRNKLSIETQHINLILLGGSFGHALEKNNSD